MSETIPENASDINKINEPNTPGQERNAEDASAPVVETPGAAPLAEPQHTADAGAQSTIDAVQAIQDEADAKGFFGERPDPRPVEDYSVEGSVRRAAEGDTTSLPQADDTTRTHQP